MRRLILCLALLMVVSMIPMAMADNDHHNQSHRVRTHLSGFNEVHFSAGTPPAPHCVALSPRRQAASSWPGSTNKPRSSTTS